MFDSGVRCPVCRGTALIRTEQTGRYGPGECMNCRADRSGELPGQEKAAMPARAAKPLPEGVTALGFGRYRLADGSTIKGYDAMLAAVNKE